MVTEGYHRTDAERDADLCSGGDPAWHQWACPRYPERGTPAGSGASAQRTAYADAMERMTVYWRSFPLLLAIAGEDPASPHAADALYHAALCRYWLTGKTYLKTSYWWTDLAKREKFWAQGDALLQRLAASYPDDALAHDDKVRRACGQLPPVES